MANFSGEKPSSKSASKIYQQLYNLVINNTTGGVWGVEVAMICHAWPATDSFNYG